MKLVRDPRNDCPLIIDRLSFFNVLIQTLIEILNRVWG